MGSTAGSNRPGAAWCWLVVAVVVVEVLVVLVGWRFSLAAAKH